MGRHCRSFSPSSKHPPNLENLGLANLYCSFDGADLISQTQEVQLSRLSVFHINRVPSAATTYLLRAIRAPSCREFGVTWSGRGPQQAELCQNFVTASFQVYLRSAEDVRVIVDPRFVKVEGKARGEDTGRFSIELGDIDMPQVWSTFVLSLFSPSPAGFQLSLDLDKCDNVSMDDVRSLPGVTKITGGGASFGVSLVEELGSAREVDGVCRWLWPKLQLLEVDGVLGLQLLRMVEARSAAYTEENDVLCELQQRPVAFESLALGRQCYISSSTLKKIRGIVGDEGVVW